MIVKGWWVPGLKTYTNSLTIMLLSSIAGCFPFSAHIHPWFSLEWKVLPSWKIKITLLRCGPIKGFNGCLSSQSGGMHALMKALIIF